MKKYKNLYINGCSFTAGHELPDSETWPFLLKQQLDIDNSINDAKNGNSFDTIMDMTFYSLLKLNPIDTLVIIGLTWSPRIGITYNNLMVNQTPNDFELIQPNNNVKLSTWRRVSYIPTEMFDGDVVNLKRMNDTNYIDSIMDGGFNEIMIKHSDYMKRKLKFDNNSIQNFRIKQLKNIIFLQNFLEHNKFDYRFVNFQHEFTDKKLHSMYNLINFDNIINNKDIIRDEKTSHPSKQACVDMANIITNDLK
jgi:hypothetical protein